MPSFKSNRVIHLPAADSGISLNIVRVPMQWIDSRKVDPNKLRRRQPVTIVNRKNGFRTIAYAMGPGEVKLGANTVAMDYDNRDQLGIAWKQREVDLEIRPARFWEIHVYAFNHPDAMIRIGHRLGYLGIALGIEPVFKVIAWLIRVVL